MAIAAKKPYQEAKTLLKQLSTDNVLKAIGYLQCLIDEELDTLTLEQDAEISK